LENGTLENQKTVRSSFKKKRCVPNGTNLRR
jgi:hypothetical protein